MKSRKSMQNSMKSRKTIEKSLKKAMEKGTWPIVPYGACHGVTGSVRGVGRGGKSRPAWLKTGGSGCHLPGPKWQPLPFEAWRPNGSHCHLSATPAWTQVAAAATCLDTGLRHREVAKWLAGWLGWLAGW